jgi:hypothetical protein
MIKSQYSMAVELSEVAEVAEVSNYSEFSEFSEYKDSASRAKAQACLMLFPRANQENKRLSPNPLRTSQ